MTENKVKFTSALKVIDTPYHITLSFCDVVPRMGKFTTSRISTFVNVTDIVYWKDSDVTVALLGNTRVIMKRKEYWESMGYTYDMEFIPHFTVGKGDVVKENTHLIGNDYDAGDEYARLF